MITLLLIVAVIAWIVVIAVKDGMSPVVAVPCIGVVAIAFVGGGIWAQTSLNPAVPTSSRWDPLVEVDGAFVVSTATAKGMAYSYFTESASGTLTEHLVSDVTLTYGELATVTTTSMEHPGGPWFWLWPLSTNARYDIQIPEGGIVR